MMYFCTLFDSNYISKGIALYLSIEKYTNDFILYIMALDRACYDTLNKIKLKHVIVECLEDLKIEELDKAKKDRSKAEFCWTCGSVITEYFFNMYGLPEITYLDSDLQFFCSPQIIEDELKEAKASIGISPHFINNVTFGIYCVQYVYFKRDKNGIACLEWWKNECLKWCYSKLEDGKYGDQKYLDYFAQKFSNVYALTNRGIGIANWNMEQYKYNIEENSLFYKGQKWPIVFFHYNGINISIEDQYLIFSTNKYFPPIIKKIFISSYAELLMKVYNDYLNIKINHYKICPQNKIKILLNAFWLYIRRYQLAMKLENWYMKKIYSQRTAPYSERSEK